MELLIILYLVWFWEALVTLQALQMLLSCVGPLMLLQRTSSWEALVYTLFAWVASLVWVLSCSFKWPAIEKLSSHFEHLKGSLLCGSTHAPSRNLILMPVKISKNQPCKAKGLGGVFPNRSKIAALLYMYTHYKGKLENTHCCELFIVQRWMREREPFYGERVLSVKKVWKSLIDGNYRWPNLDVN